MRAVRILVVALAALFSLSAACFAAADDEIAVSLSSYAQAKALAAGYAAAVKAQYEAEKRAYENAAPPLTQEQLKAFTERIRKYVEVKLAYQRAAAAFAGWRAVVTLAVIRDAAIPTADIYYQTIGRNALVSYAAFLKSAEEYLSDPLLALPHQARADRKPVPPEAAEAWLTKLIFPLYNQIEAAVSASLERKKARSDTLLAWIDKYLVWEEWDKAGAAEAKPIPPDNKPPAR
jgi:hypothetical protein